MLVWEPPHRLVLAWQISAEWAFDPALVTEVEVRFSAQPDGRTRVELEHGRLERYGELAGQMRDAYDSPGGWQGLLDGFARSVAGKTSGDAGEAPGPSSDAQAQSDSSQS